MRSAEKTKRILGNEDGATLILVAFLTVILVAFTALAVDISHLYAVRNELHNAADAGALAGARRLYVNNGTAVNDGTHGIASANKFAYDAALANKSERVAVDVNWTFGSNTGDVQRGHWRFQDRTFTPSNRTTPPDLWNVTTADLDNDLTFVNAVRVLTRRESTQADSFFARILGYAGFNVESEAVAYLGFAGTLEPFAVDLPIAICREALMSTGVYTCSIGRMINSGSSSITHNSGGWTDFDQEGNPCAGGTNASTLKNLITPCPSTGINPTSLIFGTAMATEGGQVQSAFDKLYDCWVSQTNKQQLWTKTLPVISCPSNNVGTCEQVVGAVTVNIVWINSGGTPSWSDAPTKMGDWSSTDSNGQNRWSSFVNHFQLKNIDGTDADYLQKSLYFLPDCTPHEPAGHSGGQNFGILAKIPVLVE